MSSRSTLLQTRATATLMIEISKELQAAVVKFSSILTGRAKREPMIKLSVMIRDRVIKG